MIFKTLLAGVLVMTMTGAAGQDSGFPLFDFPESELDGLIQQWNLECTQEMRAYLDQERGKAHHSRTDLFLLGYTLGRVEILNEGGRGPDACELIREEIADED